MSATDVISIEYGLPRASDAGNMARLMGEIFSQRDPPAYAMGITAAEFEDFVKLLCPKAIRDELTLVARRADTNELVGVMLTEDCDSPMPDGIEKLSPKFEPILDILGQLGAEYWRENPPRPGESLHLFLLGVDEQFAGRGIAQRLVSECLNHGAGKGYRIAVTEATNRISQHVFRKAGFEDRVRRTYEEHRFNGRACFHSIAEEGGPILMDRPLASA